MSEQKKNFLYHTARGLTFIAGCGVAAVGGATVGTVGRMAEDVPVVKDIVAGTKDGLAQCGDLYHGAETKAKTAWDQRFRKEAAKNEPVKVPGMTIEAPVVQPA
jgi:hypothetical protein